jgi:hypothetical protein
MATARITDCNNDCDRIDTPRLGVLLSFLSPKASSMAGILFLTGLLSPVVVTATLMLIGILAKPFSQAH